MLQKPRVVLAEDEASLRSFLALALNDEGYEVLPAKDGKEALELTALGAPHCILLDMRMPRVDGWEFARRYREQPGEHAPIIVMTANIEAPRAARDVGAVAYLIKPFDLDALLTVLDQHCQGV